MKSFFLTILTICAFVISTFAQNPQPFKKNILKYGYGSTFHNNNLAGNLQYGEYSRFLGKRVSLNLLGGLHKADDMGGESGEERSIKTFDGNLNLFLSPIANEKNNLKLGGGGAFRTGDYRFRDSIEMDFVTTNFQTYGWNVNMEYEIYIANAVVIGSKVSYSQFDNGDSNYFFGLNAGFKF